MVSMDYMAWDHKSGLTVMEKTAHELQVENTSLQAKANDLFSPQQHKHFRHPRIRRKGEFISALLPGCRASLTSSHWSCTPHPTAKARRGSQASHIHFPDPQLPVERDDNRTDPGVHQTASPNLPRLHSWGYQATALVPRADASPAGTEAKAQPAFLGSQGLYPEKQSANLMKVCWDDSTGLEIFAESLKQYYQILKDST